jgi:hypothetical protein
MKAVVVATDYVKDINDEFKVLEMNTNTAIIFRDANNYLELDALEQFVTDNGITNIEIIIPKRTSPKLIDTEYSGSDVLNIPFENAIYNRLQPNNVIVNVHHTEPNAITVPELEDNDTTLIIRVSYDSTALIDSVYCTDNFEFLSLMYNDSADSIPKTYFVDDELGLDSIGNIIRDNGDYPNYIIKQRFPTTNYEQYPKILKISTLEELTSIKENLLPNTLLQEYVFNSSDVFEGKLKTYRVISLIYGSNLDILDITHPFIHTNACAFNEIVDFAEDGNLAVWERPCYLQKHASKELSDARYRYQFDNESKIFMPDGSMSTVDTIQSGSILKTLNFPDMPLDESGSVETWKKGFTDLSNGLEITTTIVAEYSALNRNIWLIHLELSNGVKFVDVEFGRAISKIHDQTEYQFNRFMDMNISGSMLLFNNETNAVEEAIITKIEYSYETINVYSVDVEPLDYLLTAEEGVESPVYAMFQHNPPPSCNQVCCTWSTNGANSSFQCAVTGYSGECWTGTFDYCVESGIPWGCYGCVSSCLGSCIGGAKQ